MIWVAVMGVMLISFVGLAIDYAIAYLAGSQLQIAADAGSLAGARWVREDDLNVPRQKAFDIAFENKVAGVPLSLDLNGGNDPAGDIVIGRFYRFADDYAVSPRCPTPNPPCFFPQTDPTDPPNAVRVHAQRKSGSNDGQVPLVFGATPLFNMLGIDVMRTGTAIIAGSTGSGLITLDPHGECTLDIRGNVELDLGSADGWDGEAAIQVDSDNECALCGDGSALELTAPETNIVGSNEGYCFTGDPTVDTYINPDSPYIADPLRYLAAPPTGLDLGEIDPSDDTPTYYPPGYYSGGMKISGGKQVRLGTAAPGPGNTPGIYVMEGTANGSKGGFQTSGGASVIATNVMIYMKSGKLDLAGTGVTTITQMTDEVNSNPDYIGVSIFQARDNPTEARIIGNADMNLDGTLYFPNNRLEVGGTGIALGNQLIAWQLYLHGEGTFEIQYDGRFPAPGAKVFLVQ
jgi:hypothetical protein